MTTVHFTTENPRHFICDSKGELYEVSEEIAITYEALHPATTVHVDHVDEDTNTIWFHGPLPKEVQA